VETFLPAEKNRPARMQAAPIKTTFFSWFII